MPRTGTRWYAMKEKNRGKGDEKRPLGFTGRPASSCRRPWHEPSDGRGRSFFTFSFSPFRREHRSKLFISRFFASRICFLSSLLITHYSKSEWSRKSLDNRAEERSIEDRFATIVQTIYEQRNARYTQTWWLFSDTYLRSNLVTTLASLDMDDFPHVCSYGFCRWPLKRTRYLRRLRAIVIELTRKRTD